MPIAEDSAGGSPVPVPTDLTTNLTGQATGSGTLDYTTGDIDIAVTVVDNGHNHILSNITDVQVNNAISGQILVYNGTVWANATNTAGITAIVQDLTPQLGGNLDLNNRNITGTGNIAITGTIDGRDVSADGTKLDGIESGATADQTAAQIKTAYESNANTNNFADADVSKLSGIEPGATADQTASQIKTAYESNADTNAFTDADNTKLDGIETSADVTDTTNVVASLTAGTNVTIAADGTISATGGTSGIAHVVDDTTPQLGGNLDLNSNDITGTGNLNFTGNVTLSGTVDGRDVAADGTKLDGIEASADVTDTANVTAAGALMDSEVTNLAQVKAFDSSDYATAAQGTTADAALPTTGGTMTGDILFNDGVKAKYGTSSDLQIYHDGSDSYITDSGTGILFLRTNQLQIQSDDGLETYGVFTDNGAVNLYHNNIEKFATTSSGIDVTGKIQVTSADPEIFLTDTTTNVDHSIDGNSGVGNLFIHVDKNNEGSDPKLIVNVGSQSSVLVAKSTGIDVTNVTNMSMDASASGQIKVQGSGYGFGIALDADAANLYTNSPTRDLVFGVNETEVARVKPAGLDVTGSITSDALTVDTTASNGVTINAHDNATTTYPLKVSNAAGSGNLELGTYGINNNIDLKLQRGGSTKLTVTSSGIDVTGTVVADKMFVEGTANSRQWEAGSAGQKLAIYAYDNSTFYHRLETGNATNYQWGTYDNIPIYTITNNSVKTTLLGNGNFGVGTTAPQVKLQTTVANASTEAIRITNDADSVRTHMFPAEIQAHNSNLTLNANDGGFATIIKTANTERMRIDSGGIDVTGKAKISASTTFNAPSLGSSSANAQLHLTNNDTNYGLVVGNSSADGHVWFQAQRTDGTATAYNITLNEAGGNVGIGTTSPNHELHIESTSPTIRLVDTDGNNTIDIGQSGSACYIDFDNTVRFRNLANVERLRVDSNGIDVTGDLTVSSTIEVGSLTPNQDGAIEVGVIALGTPAIASTTSSTGLMNHIIFDNPNGAVGKINTLNSSTTYLTSSDYRLKTDVQAMTGSIDRIKALRPVNFEWVVDGTRVDGFLAHEAQEVVPEAVDGEKDAMRDQQYVESEATGDIYTPAVDATYETIQVELTPAVDAVYETVTVEISPAVEATYDEDGNELTPAIEAVTEQQEQLVTPAVDATYEEQQQELTPAIDEVIHSSDVVEPDELEEGQLWRETTEKVMATRQVPDYQGIDQSKIVPLLTSALQDAIAKIEALETRLEALES